MRSKSFTLIELLVVIVIIGILAGVIVVSTSSAIEKANLAKAQAFSSTVKNELFSDLVSEWTFDNASSPGEDTWGNNDGTVVGATYQSKASGACIYGGCYLFNGSDNIIDFGTGSDMNPAKNLTITAWIKRSDESSAQMPIVSRWGPLSADLSYMLHIYQNKAVSIVRQGTLDRARNGVTLIKKETWYFLVFKFDGDEPYLYINGASEGTLAGSKVTTMNQSSTGKNLIGRKADNTSYYLGLIDDVRIYDTALSSAKIKQEYVAGLEVLLSKNIISQEEYEERIGFLAEK